MSKAIGRGAFSPQLSAVIWHNSRVIALSHYCRWNNMPGITKWIVVSIICTGISNYFCISKVSCRREKTELRWSMQCSLTLIFVSWDIITLGGKMMSPKSLCGIRSRPLRRYLKHRTFLSHLRLSSLSQHRKKQSLFVRHYFVLFRVIALSCTKENITAPKYLLTGYQWLETRLFCLWLPRWSHWSYLMLLTQNKNQYRKETVRTPPLFCVFVWER